MCVDQTPPASLMPTLASLMNDIEEITPVLNEPGVEKQRALLGELRQSSDGEQILLALARGVHGPGIRRWAIEGLAAYRTGRLKRS